MCAVTQPGAIWQQRQKDIRPYHWKHWYGSAETRAKTTETCGVPGLPFVFVAKIAGLRVGHCNVSGLLAHPIVGCKPSILFFNVIRSWLVWFHVVLGIFNLVLFSWMGKKSSRVEWQARWNMRFPAGTCGTVLWKASIVIQAYPTEICGSCCKAFHCVHICNTTLHFCAHVFHSETFWDILQCAFNINIHIQLSMFGVSANTVNTWVADTHICIYELLLELRIFQRI